MNKKIKNIIIIIVIILVCAIIYGIKKIVDDNNYDRTIQKIMADDVEIEKKWLIKEDEIPYNLANAERIEIEQTYICFSPEIRVRKINDGEEYTFAVKTNITSDGMIRDEIETNITEEEYNNLITKKEGKTINKTRYQFLDGNNLLAIDIFSGDLKGLAYLEIEFNNKDEAKNFTEPWWIIRDVTADLNYKNGYLARFGIPESFLNYIE